MSPPASATLADLVRNHRTSRHMSITDLVRTSGMSYSTVRKIEDGRIPNPGILTVIPLLTALNIPLEEVAALAVHDPDANLPS